MIVGLYEMQAECFPQAMLGQGHTQREVQAGEESGFFKTWGMNPMPTLADPDT